MAKAIGIDVSKAVLDVAFDDQRSVQRFANEPDGWAQLIALLKGEITEGVPSA